jgi:protein subunit release factor A
LFRHHNIFSRNAKLKELAELFLNYADLEKRLADALELSQFESLASDLEREIVEIKAILDMIAQYTFFQSEDDYLGAFVTIKGEYHEDANNLLKDLAKKKREMQSIEAIANYLNTNFFSATINTSSEKYENDILRQQEMTVWVNDVFAYGKLKQLSGEHKLFGKKRTLALQIEVCSAINFTDDIWQSAREHCRIRVFRWQVADQKVDNVVEIEHIPSKITARASDDYSQLQNLTIAKMLLYSRIHQTTKMNEPENSLSYLWRERFIIDHLKKQIYPFAEASQIAKLLISQLETLSEFSEE